ncbi:hypothetical protein BH09BAC3_BH09BAC3_15190 [soil metagenome]
MFDFVVRYLGFLKHVPVLPHLFDAGLKIGLIFGKGRVLDYLDDIENEVLSWEKTSTQLHKYGGLQFNLDKVEIGHVHGNGLLDILFSKEMKLKFVGEGRVKEHHIFKNSGWISFYILTAEDKRLAIELLRCSYDIRHKRSSSESARHFVDLQ